MENPFNNRNIESAVESQKVNVAPLLKGEGLIKLLAKLADKGLMEWDAERSLAMVIKKVLTEVAGTTENARSLRSWLGSQGFRGSRRSRSFYLSLADLESRGVTIVDGKPQVCEPKVKAKAQPKVNPFADILSLS